MEPYLHVVKDWWTQLNSTTVSLTTVLVALVVFVVCVNLPYPHRRKIEKGTTKMDPHARRTQVMNLLAEDFATAMSRRVFRGQMKYSEFRYWAKRINKDLGIRLVFDIRQLDQHPMAIKAGLKKLKDQLKGVQFLRHKRKEAGRYVADPLAVLAKAEKAIKPDPVPTVRRSKAVVI